jgi:hypothetical protein
MSRNIENITSNVLKKNQELYSNDNLVIKEIEDIKKTLKNIEKKIDFIYRCIKNQN